MPCTPEMLLTACLWPHHTHRLAANSGGPRVCHHQPHHAAAHNVASAATYHAVARLHGTCCCSQTTRAHRPGEQGTAVPEAAWQACGHIQHPLFQQGPNKTVPAGPAGCGKTTVLRVLADSLGFELCTWEAPTPVLWQEHLHQVCCLATRQRWQE